MNPCKELFLNVAPGIETKFIRCPSTLEPEWREEHQGETWFWMGCDEKQRKETDAAELENAKPSHRVTINHPFAVMDHPVSWLLWNRFMPRQETVLNGDAPVTGVSWNDCQEFIHKINEKRNDGFRFSLPTEAQWEFACTEGGSKKAYLLNSGSNHWRVCSMCTGCAEWCFDDLRDYDTCADKPIVDPVGSLTSPYAAIRGGAMENVCRQDRPFVRRSARKTTREANCGFRLVCC